MTAGRGLAGRIMAVIIVSAAHSMPAVEGEGPSPASVIGLGGLGLRVEFDAAVALTP